MSKTPIQKLQKRLQQLLNEIATLGPDQHIRFAILKKKAKKVLVKMKQDFPDLKTIPLQQPHGK